MDGSGTAFDNLSIFTNTVDCIDVGVATTGPKFNGHYISNLTFNTSGMQYISTTTLLSQYGHLIDDKTVEQVKNLGVDNRYLARPLSQYILDEELGGEMHKGYLISVAGKCMMKTSLDIDNIIVASEIADYQTPGLASIILSNLGLSKFIPVFNLQGTACSSMPRVIELARNLKGNTLCIIDGITSDMYQTELGKIRSTIQPKSKEWVKLMFAMLFGDCTCAFIINKDGGEQDTNYKILRQAHVMNLYQNDYTKASVKRNKSGFTMRANPEINERALHYTDVVLTKMGIETFGHYNRIVLHTGSRKIIDGYSSYYKFDYSQLQPSYQILHEFGNTTGCSLPLVLNRGSFLGKALMIGITMGFGVDIVELST